MTMITRGVLGARCPVLRCLALCLVLVPGASCGSKGDPLPPFRPIPAKPAGLSATRIEGRPTLLRFTVPAANDDGSVPADVAAVRVYAITQPASTPAPTALDLLGGELVVATIDVAPAPVAVEGEVPAVPAAPPAPATPVPTPGAPVVWEDTVDTTTYATPMVRYYAVGGVSSRNRVGPMSDVVAVPLTPLEGKPSNLSASFTAGAIKLDWLGVTATSRYRVYEVAKNVPGVPEVPGVPLNPKPIEGTTFEVPIGAASAEPGARPAYGVERCFIVRAASAEAGASIESAAAGPVCVTPRDVFAPAAPANLTAIASEGAVNLIWDAVDAGDLAGYIVLRGEADGATLQPLFETPITETMYRDTTAVAGTRYTYAVVAVDTASPANRSAESNRVIETGRN